MVNIDSAAPKVTVGTATGKTQQSTGNGDLALPHIPPGIPLKGHLMPGFRHTLIGLSPLCNAKCTVTFTYEAVIVRENHGTAVLTGWREATGTRLWQIYLMLGEGNFPSMLNNAKQAIFGGIYRL